MTDADDVLAAIRRRSAALVRKDMDVLLELLHPSFIYVNNNGQVLNRDEYLDLYVRESAVRWARHDIHEARMAESDGMVVVAFLVRDVGCYQDTDFDETFRSTSSWIKRGRTWQCLGGHTSGLPDS